MVNKLNTKGFYVKYSWRRDIRDSNFFISKLCMPVLGYWRLQIPFHAKLFSSRELGYWRLQIPFHAKLFSSRELEYWRLQIPFHAKLFSSRELGFWRIQIPFHAKLFSSRELGLEVYRYGNFGFYRYRLYFCQNLPIPIINPILILHMSNNDSLHIPCIHLYDLQTISCC